MRWRKQAKFKRSQRTSIHTRGRDLCSIAKSILDKSKCFITVSKTELLKKKHTQKNNKNQNPESFPCYSVFMKKKSISSKLSRILVSA